MSCREELNNSLILITSMNSLIVLRCISKSSLIHIYVLLRENMWDGGRGVARWV
jgi:hypothetical protein